jgi:anti-sigma B factor antagonist
VCFGELSAGNNTIRVRAQPTPVPLGAEFQLTDEAVDDHTHVVAVRGDIDLYSAPDLRECLDELIAAGKTRVLVDLREASFIDSTTLGVLVGAIKRLRIHGGQLALACDDPSILRVFAITGLDEVIGVHPTREAGVAALKAA